MPLIKFHGMPGTGKTTALINVLKDNNYDLNAITFCTFRRGVADEIKQKTGGEKNGRINTIHGVVLRLLREKLGEYSVFTNKDKRDFYVKNGIVFDYTDTNNDLDTAGRMIQAACTHLTFYGSLDTFPAKKEFYPVTYKDEDWLIAFFERYVKHKQEAGKHDFDDIIKDGLTHGIVPDTDVLFVDEFQDLSKPQFDLFSSWLKQVGTTYIAGDPYQSIQGWAGGTPDFWFGLKGENRFLDKSYRLYQNMIDYSWSLLRGQAPPFVKSAKNGAGGIRRVSVFEAKALWEQYSESTLHLFRSHYLYKKDLVPIILHLTSAGIPFFCSAPGYGWQKSDCDLYNMILKFRGGDRSAPVLKHIFSEMEKGVNKELYQTDLSGQGGLEAQLISNEPFIRGFKFMARSSRGKRISGALRFWGKPVDFDLLQAGTGVRVMSIHAAKGLEADTVFLYNGMSRKSIFGKCFGSEEYKEEQRVWFVGASRARERLFLVDCPNSAGGKWYL